MNKWDMYHSQLNLPPWESGLPTSQIMKFVLDECASIPIFARVIDLGCGGGQTAIWLADTRLFSRVVGIDVSFPGLKRASIRDVERKVEWILDDILHAGLTYMKGQFEIAIDVQTYHAIRTNENQYVVAEAISSYLAQNGILVVITGNNNESLSSTTGPSMLSRHQIEEPFIRAGLKLLSITEDRFDKTLAYGEQPPLCWVVTFQKP